MSKLAGLGLVMAVMASAFWFTYRALLVNSFSTQVAAPVEMIAPTMEAVSAPETDPADKGQTALIPSPKPTMVPSPAPTATTDVSLDSQLRDWLYPYSTILNQSPQRADLRTAENPDTVTAWYRQRFEERNMRATSFVTTTTNGQVKNVLAGNNGYGEVKVTITGNKRQAETGIAVEI